MRLLLDINFVLDALLKRQPNFPSAALIMREIKKKRLTCYIASFSLPIIYYFCYKHYSIKLDDKQARQLVLDDVWTCLRTFTIRNVGYDELEAGANMPGRDFEDNVQIACALAEGLDAIVTSNIKDFRGAGITLYTPAQLVKKLKLRWTGSAVLHQKRRGAQCAPLIHHLSLISIFRTPASAPRSRPVSRERGG